jgi:hypothetical protein
MKSMRISDYFVAQTAVGVTLTAVPVAMTAARRSIQLLVPNGRVAFADEPPAVAAY